MITMDTADPIKAVVSGANTEIHAETKIQSRRLLINLGVQMHVTSYCSPVWNILAPHTKHLCEGSL